MTKVINLERNAFRQISRSGGDVMIFHDVRSPPNVNAGVIGIRKASRQETGPTAGLVRGEVQLG